MALMWNEILEQPNVIKDCIDVNKDIINKLANEIKRRNIGYAFLVARGTSDHAATYGKYALEIVAGLPAGLAASSVFTMYNRKIKLANSLYIAVSQSGQAADALEALRAAKSEGALTVSITNFPDSPLAIEADFHLNCNAGLEKSVAATKTFTAEMLLLGMLAAELAEDRVLYGQFAEIPDKMRETIKLIEPALINIDRYRFINECFVLARGTNYPIALEAALKIQETTYVRAKGFAISDFQHGPKAMLDKSIPVILFAPDGPSFNEMSAMIKDLEDMGIEAVIFTNRKDVLAKHKVCFEVAETNNDLISPFINAVAAQMFACRLSLVKGLDPDKPRLLKKVTITR